MKPARVNTNVISTISYWTIVVMLASNLGQIIASFIQTYQIIKSLACFSFVVAVWSIRTPLVSTTHATIVSTLSRATLTIFMYKTDKDTFTINTCLRMFAFSPLATRIRCWIGSTDSILTYHLPIANTIIPTNMWETISIYTFLMLQTIIEVTAVLYTIGLAFSFDTCPSRKWTIQMSRALIRLAETPTMFCLQAAVF